MSKLRAAQPDDLRAIRGLLAAASLPVEGIEDHLQSFVIAEADDGIAGAGGLEVYGACALIRSIVVAPDKQRRGIAAAICDHLEKLAAASAVEHIYLLTETAEQFFARRGYAQEERADVPPEIASTQEFSELCPDSAVLMRLSVA